MTRLYIVEQSGLEPGGHYYAYTCCTADGARRLGLDPVVLANKRFRDSEASGRFEVLPCFTYSWSEAETKGRLDWGEGNIAYELFEGLRRLPPESDDHVFLHTLGYRELQALLACLTTGLMPGDPIPYFHILLRRDPDILSDSYGEFADYFRRIAQSPYLRQKILLHTDTDLLSAAFAELCRVPFATAPIPFDQTVLLDALAARPPRRPDEPLTIAYLGDAREEKGYQHLPQALAQLWPDYIATGRARFVLQSNFNTPGGETGILAAAQNLAGFPGTSLKTEALQPTEYYQLLADSDIVLIPYSAERYRYRSSGVLVEAMGAGKVVVTTAGSWMATQVAADHAMLYDRPEELGPAIAQAIDCFEALSAGAAARRDAMLAHATGDSLVQHLLNRADAAAAAAPARTGRRILLVIGDAMVLQNGASRVAQAQLRYLAAAGHDVVGLFLTANRHPDAASFAEWRRALSRALGAFPIERVFIAGPGHEGSVPEAAGIIRDQARRNGAALRAEFDFTATFEFGADLLKFLRAHPIDAVLLNYITNFPVIDALGLDGAPVICEMHDLQSFQRAIYGGRLVDPADLDEEFAWLSRCAALTSLSERETAIVRQRLPGMAVETTGVFLPAPPPVLPSLAGAADLAEIVSSCGPALPEYQLETARRSRKTAAVDRLNEIGIADLLYVSSAHLANVSGLKWFLSRVYEPYLAQHQVSVIVAGSICGVADWPALPRVAFVGQVDDLAPLYAAARVVVLPIREGAGSPIKTFEAFAYGRPIVATPFAFRGIEREAEEFGAHEDPAEFARAVLALLESEEARRRTAARARHAARRYTDFDKYFAAMDRVFQQVLGDPAALIQPAEPPPAGERYIEWSHRLQALNRAVRAYLEGAPLESGALQLLATYDAEDLDPLIEGVCRSLLEQRDAAVLRSEPRLLQHSVAEGSCPQASQQLRFALQLALADYRARDQKPPGDGVDVLVHRGLPLKIVGIARQPLTDEPSITADGERLAVRPLAASEWPFDAARLFESEIAPVATRISGLRSLALRCAANSQIRLAVLRHSLPIAQRATILGRAAFGGAFEFPSDRAVAELPPGRRGTLLLPRIADGSSRGFVDLVFAEPEGDLSDTALRLLMLLNNRPVEGETIRVGPTTLVRVPVPTDGNLSDFGVLPLTIENRTERRRLRLAAVHSGLLLGSDRETLGTATVLSLAGQRLEPAAYASMAALARNGIAAIVVGDALPPGTISALSALATAADGRDRLCVLASQELDRAAGHDDGPATGMQTTVEAVVADTYAIVAGCLGVAENHHAILCPALPIEVLDEAGDIDADATAAAQRDRGKSWRVPLRPNRPSIRVYLDATLEIAGHPDTIRHTGFHPMENPERFRWTGPSATSTITLPVALAGPARLVIELGPTGKNHGAGDFKVTCNGSVVPHSLESVKDRTRLIADLPPRRFAVPSTEIGLSVRECFKPEPPDRRTLGVVFRSLSLYLDAPEATDPTSGVEPGEVRAAATPSNGAARLVAGERSARRSALVIDDSVPEPDKDAGSNAILEHMRSLQRLGYRVSFIPADNMAQIEPYTGALEQEAVRCFYRPRYESVEDVLAKHPEPFDLVYLHRHANTSKYARKIRQHSPAARVLYCVADLHFLRLQRQAEIEGDQTASAKAETVRQAELDAMWSADCVIVHSSAEAALIRQISPATDVRVVPWTIELRDVAKINGEQPELAFIGGYRHPPNVDAAKWAVQRIMPLLRKQVPDIELLLVGSRMPQEVAALAAPDVVPLGHVPSLDDIFGRVRLTIAPLRYGAGLKGKVIDSMAAGVPCVMSTIAAEGLDLPRELQSVVCDEPGDVAQRIAALCRDDADYRRIAEAGRAYVAINYSAQRIDTLLREACGL